MLETEAVCAGLCAPIPAATFRHYLEGWLIEGEYQNLAARTLRDRSIYVERLRWFLDSRELTVWGPGEARRFMLHVRNGHQEPGGRWGSSFVPVSARTQELWWATLHSLQQYLMDEGLIRLPFLRQRDKPKVPKHDIEPFEPEHLEALRAAARRSLNPHRNESLISFLLDNGVRESELCNLTLADIDFQTHQAHVVGKGAKERNVRFGKVTKKLLWRYLHCGPPRERSAPLFTADHGTRAGEALTPSGLYQLIQRLGEAAGITGVRCSPHTFRHTFAIEWLRGGGGELDLQRILGHETLEMSSRYAKVANADVLRKHRVSSPTDRLFGGPKR